MMNDYSKTPLLLMYRYAFEHQHEIVRRKDIDDYLASNGYDMANQALKDNINHLLMACFSTSGSYYDPEARLFAQPEIYGEYLDFIELREANKSGKEARKYAILAIVVSAIMAYLQLLIELYKP